MSVFSQAEADYLASQQFARIATVGANEQAHVVPVRFRYNPETDAIDVGGRGFAQDKKCRDVQCNPRVAIVIDDVASVDPWRPRMIESRGLAEVMETGGEIIRPGNDPRLFRITPERIVSVGIEGQGPYALNTRSVS